MPSAALIFQVLHSMLYIPSFISKELYSKFIFQVVYIPGFIFQVLHSKFYIPIHGSNISRWQTRLRACQIMELRTWIATFMMARDNVESCERRGLHVMVRRIRQGATNSDAWKGNKLSVTELLVSACSKPVFRDMSWEEVSGSIETKCILADIKPLKGTSTGMSTLGVVEAQLNSVVADPK